MKKIVLIFLLMVYAFGAYGQESNQADPSQLKTNNIGLGAGMVYLINEAAWAPGLHLHYSKTLGEKQKLSLGTGAELVMGEHQHASLAVALEYVPFAALSIGYGPCLEFPVTKDADHGVELIHHFELSYEFDLGIIHLGPMVEYAFNKNDQHFMLGIHTGYSF